MRRRTTAVFVVFLFALAFLLVIWASRPARVSVYFISSAGDAATVVAVSRLVSARTVEAQLAAAMVDLLAGPDQVERAAGLVTAIPRGTRLRGVDIRNRIAYVDLSREVEAGGGSSSMLGRFWQIVYTATQFRQAPQVRILIDGQERDAMGGEGILIDQPVARPAEPPKF